MSVSNGYPSKAVVSLFSKALTKHYQEQVPRASKEDIEQKVLGQILFLFPELPKAEVKS